MIAAMARWSVRGLAVALLLSSAFLAGTSASSASAAPERGRYLTSRANALGNHPAARAKKRYGARTRYARIRRVCPLPARGRAACFALLRVPVAAGAAGAAPFLQDDGATASGPAGGLTPAQLASAYEYAPTEGGTGQTVAIVDAFDDPKIEADLGTFDGNYGLPACTTANGCFTKVSQTGSTTSLPKADKTGWSAEIALDVETVHSVCENCKILLVEVNAETFTDLEAGVDEAVTLGATEVSNSYGGSEEAGEWNLTQAHERRRA